MKPPKSILDRAFKYVPAANTNIRETFERIRAGQGRTTAKPSKVTSLNASIRKSR